MLLLDSLYINNSGGKVLLDYLVKNLEEKNILTYYLFDDRCKSDYKDIPVNRKVYLKASLTNRHKFYGSAKGKFTTVFCFGNLAPTMRLSIPVYTYFHQSIFLSIPAEFTFYQRIIFNIKGKIFKYLLRNTDFLLVQNNCMKERVEKKFKFPGKKICLMPFFPPSSDSSLPLTNRDINTFIYVSGDASHKNHLRLLTAFCNFYDKRKKGRLILTISETATQLTTLIKELQIKNYPIENIGYVNRADLAKHYQSSEYLIFPSLEESFGLGIVEAIDCGCKVIGADLPYMYEVCRPSIVFNPYENSDIERALNDAIDKNESSTEKKIYDKIDELLNLLSGAEGN